jgi:hypothetical protein
MPRVFAVVPGRGSTQIEQLLDAVRTLADERDWPVSVRRTESVRVAGEGWERRAELLRPEDAAGLYREIHRTPTLVVAFAAAMVRRDPSRDPPVRRAALGLEEFVAYKAPFGLIRGHTDPARIVAGFETWLAGVHCDGDADPRALPLHVFDAGPRCPDLSAAEGAAAFAAQHGHASGRTDADGVDWRRADPRAFHGGKALEVAGRVLPAGFHWDVSRRRGEVRLTTAEAVWKLAGKGTYLNVYPDAHVRAPKDPRVRRVWPKPPGK